MSCWLCQSVIQMRRALHRAEPASETRPEWCGAAALAAAVVAGRVRTFTCRQAENKECNGENTKLLYVSAAPRLCPAARQPPCRCYCNEVRQAHGLQDFEGAVAHRRLPQRGILRHGRAASSAVREPGVCV